MRYNYTMQPTRISDLRVEKTSTILRLFLGGGVLTRKEIESRTGISYGTISIILRRMLSMGVLERPGKVSSNGGRRADAYRIVADRAVFAQVSVTSYGFIWSVRDLHGTVRAHGSLPDDQDRPIDEIFLDTVAGVMECGADLDARCDGISLGVIVPGHYRESSDTIVKPSRPRVAELHIRESLRGRFEGEVLVESDVNAAAFVGISTDGDTATKRETTLFIVVTADGIGASIILDGSIYYGAAGHAGEIHMVPVNVDGNTILLGDVVDSAAVAARLADVEGMTSPPDFLSLRSLINDADERVERIYPLIVDAFAQALYILDSILDPDRIVLAGPYCGFGPRWSRDVGSRLREISEPHLMDEVIIDQAPNSLDLDLVGMWRQQAFRWLSTLEGQAGIP